jgi:hypothetical protein
MQKSVFNKYYDFISKWAVERRIPISVTPVLSETLFKIYFNNNFLTEIKKYSKKLNNLTKEVRQNCIFLMLAGKIYDTDLPLPNHSSNVGSVTESKSFSYSLGNLKDITNPFVSEWTKIIGSQPYKTNISSFMLRTNDLSKKIYGKKNSAGNNYKINLGLGFTPYE